MGGFVVYGVSRMACRKKAEAATPVLHQTVVEWDTKVRELAEKHFDESDKKVRISPELDRPRFCEDWIADGAGQVKLTQIMCRGERIEKHGAVTIKGGQPVMTWIPFDETKMPGPPFPAGAHP